MHSTSCPRSTRSGHGPSGGRRKRLLKRGSLFPAVLTLANLKSAQSVSVLSADRLFCCAADLMNEPTVRIETYVAAQCGFAASNFGRAFAGSPRKHLPKEYRISRVAPLHTYRMFCNKHRTCHGVWESRSEPTFPYSTYARASKTSSFPPTFCYDAILASLPIAFQ
jgi:hypothetical protein